MAEVSKNITVLKPHEEKRLDDLFDTFSKKNEGIFMRFNDFFQMILERSMVSNRYGISLYYRCYNLAIASADIIVPEKSPAKQKDPVFSLLPQQHSKPEKNTLTKSKFYFMITLLAKEMFHSEKTRMEKMFNEILAEKVIINKEMPDNPRCIRFDEINKKIVDEITVKILVEYESELQRCFTLYFTDNRIIGRMMLSWKELAIQNKKLSSFSVIKFLKEADVLPNLLNIEKLEEIIMNICPTVSIKEHHFFTNNKIITIYDKDIHKQEVKYEGDPQFQFHEFQLLLVRIAVETFPQEQFDIKKDLEKILKRFFKEILCVRTNAEVERGVPIPNFNRPFLKYLEMSYEGKGEQLNRLKSQMSTVKKDTLELYEDPNKLLEEYQNKNLFDAEMAKIDFADVYKLLDRELPAMPPPLANHEHDEKFSFENFIDDRNYVVVGESRPVEKDNKNKKQTAKMPKRSGKDDKNKKEFKWDRPAQSVEFYYDYLKKKDESKESKEEVNKGGEIYNRNYLNLYRDQLNFGQPLISDFERGTLSKIEVAPCLIKEIIYPGDVPKSSRIFLEAAISSHNNQNYSFALENFETAKRDWLESSGKDDLSEQVQLYFEFSAGQVYESAGRDDYALLKFLNCKFWGDKLPFNNPDRALSFCGIGSVLYHMEEYQLALRSFLKAREVRESLIGEDTVDTATIYNNLGCCMLLLERTVEAISYFKLAQAILEAELGQFHFRTLTAGANLNKCKVYELALYPEFKKPWKFYQDDYKKKLEPVEDKKKKGDKNGGKKKK